jgi:hypothetical protein
MRTFRKKKKNTTVPYPSSCTMALGLTQPLTEISTTKTPGSRAWAARKGDITAIFEPIA